MLDHVLSSSEVHVVQNIDGSECGTDELPTVPLHFAVVQNDATAAVLERAPDDSAIVELIRV